MPSVNNRKKQGGRMTLAANPQQMMALDSIQFSPDKAAETKAPIETPSRVSNDTWMNNLSPELKLKYEKYLKQQRDYVNNTNLTDLDVLITISDGLY
tara:strand:+ start:151 stop:441 length:291 start_codon:yes stop_codon:yes gene_type:complete